MTRAGKLVIAAVAAPVAVYAVWSRAGRGYRGPLDLHLSSTVSYGADHDRGNLLGVEPYMTAGDYSSPERFAAKLDGYLSAAREKGWIGPKTVAVFPEYLGTWLVATGEKASVDSAPSTAAAMRTVVLSNIPAFLAAWIGSDGKDRATAAVFRMKARAMAAAYDGAFRSLAKRYRVTIVGGTIVLPSPSVESGRLVAGSGPLYNACAVYGPDGDAMAPVVRKVYPTPDEAAFVAGGSVDQVPVFDTPAGRLGVIVCADSWSPLLYAHLREQGVDFLAVPSFGGYARRWNEPWKGYSTEIPADVDRADKGRLTEKEAWLKYAMPGRHGASGAANGMNVFFQGRMWDFAPEAQTLVVDHGATRVRDLSPDHGGVLINLWL